MKEYTYHDFFNTLDKTGQSVLAAMNGHIASHYPAYKPLDVKPKNKAEKEWVIHYRQKPKVGKAICSAYSVDGKLSLRFCFLSSMTHEFLARQHEFSDRAKATALKQILCVGHTSCRSYGGNTICEIRQYYWLNNRLSMTCPYPWVSFAELTPDDSADIRLMIDLQMRHMVQDAKDIKGSSYMKTTAQRCKEVQTISTGKIVLDMDVSNANEHVKKASRLDKYARLYHLVPMGAHTGIWYYLNNELAGDEDGGTVEYAGGEIPKGNYAAVTVHDPFTFSLSRAWNYLCKRSLDAGEKINGITLSSGRKTACFAKFFMEAAEECMTVYVPLI